MSFHLNTRNEMPPLANSKRIYIAGPMSGLPDFNRPAFHQVAASLRGQGYHVENPAENKEPPCGTWQGYMRQSLVQLATCDAIYMLTGWERSRGAMIEFRLATELGFDVWFERVDAHALRGAMA